MSRKQSLAADRAAAKQARRDKWDRMLTKFLWITAPVSAVYLTALAF